MRTMCVMIVAACLWAVPVQTLAAEAEPTGLIVCVVTSAMECGPYEGCVSGTAESFSLPRLLRVDLDERVVSASKAGGPKRSSRIKNLEMIEGNVILQGSENGRGWSLLFVEESGMMSATVAGHQEGFIVFGECMTP